MRYLPILMVVLLASQSRAHEVKPAPRKESCAAMKWLNSERAVADPQDMSRNIYLKKFANQAGDECEEYQEQAIDWADKEAEISAAIERAAKEADQRLSR